MEEDEFETEEVEQAEGDGEEVEVEAKVDDVDNESGSEEQPESDLQQDDGGSDDDVVVLQGEEKTEDEEDHKAAPQWVKDLRKKNREYQKRTKQLERQLQELQQPKESSDPGPKPTLESCDYDEEVFEQKVEQWHAAKAEQAQKQQLIQQYQQQEIAKFQQKMQQFQLAKSQLKFKDYDEAEQVVADSFTIDQQGDILQYAEKPEVLVYYLGKNPSRAAELAETQDRLAFVSKIAKLESKLTVTKRKPTTPPEKTVKPSVGAASSAEKQLDRLRDEAKKSGDFTKVIAYKRKLRKERAA